MTVSDLIQQVRYAVNDTDNVEYTDGELLNYVNQAQDYISNVCINNTFKGLINEVDLALTNNQVALPNDFVREYSVINGINILKSIPPDAEPDAYSYKIVGKTLYSKNDTVKLYYFYKYPSYVAVSDAVVVPDVFLNLLREIVIYLALNRTNINTGFEMKLSQLYEARLLEIISGYGYSNLERPMPFVV
ncbi:phage adaptor protein [Persephonella sp.]